MHLRNLKKRQNFIKFSCFTALATGAVWIIYQIRKTRNILSNALDTSAINIMENPTTVQHKADKYVTLDLNRHKETVLDETWNLFKFTFAKRLLRLTQNENQFIRIKAVRQLSKIKTLEEWQFSTISSMIDARTAVGLARNTNIDIRFFPEPPLQYFTHTHHMLVDSIKQLMISLYAKSKHQCVEYFVSKAFEEAHDVGRLIDHDSAHLEMAKFIQAQKKRDVIPLCLETLVHHASMSDYAKDIAELNGLPLLMEIYKRFGDNLEIVANICRIISYMSFHQELLEDLFKAGWIKVLAEWVKHDDVRIAIPSAKALANLDLDENSVYLHRLYPLHPILRTTKKPDADVVFVHGLLGGVFFTWRQRDKSQRVLGLMGKKQLEETISQDNTCTMNPVKKKKLLKITDPDTRDFIEDLEEEIFNSTCKEYEVVYEDIPTNVDLNSDGPFSCTSEKYYYFNNEDGCYTCCWPRDWLAEDCTNLRIVGVNYETNLSLWAPICPNEKNKTLEDRCDELIKQMQRAGFGRKPIIWVTHSMGGLMVKNLLNKASDSQDINVKNICLNTKGIIFYSTPHLGSSIAKLSQASSYVLWPSVEVQELRKNSPKLLDIHEKFLKLANQFNFKIISFVETKATVVTTMKFKFLVVEPQSGNPGIGEYYEIPQDHLGICKPGSRYSFLYQRVLLMIKEILKGAR